MTDNITFQFEQRPSDSPYVQMVWRTESQRAGFFTSRAASYWEMVFTRIEGQVSVAVRGPETHPSLAESPPEAEFFGIVFRHGAYLNNLLPSQLVNTFREFQEGACQSFWLDSRTWERPTYENADTFVEWLKRDGLLTFDTVIAAALQGRPQDLSPRSIQRRFVGITGLTQGEIAGIERARHAFSLLECGLPIAEVVHLAGYADQPHLTRALKRFMGATPGQILRGE